jgi:hypothetical protein
MVCRALRARSNRKSEVKGKYGELKVIRGGKFLSFLGAIALCLDGTAAFSAEAKSRKKAEPTLDASAVDRRVGESKHVFVGEGVRIYFVDRRYRETPYVRAAGDGSIKTAMVVVKVVKPLHPAGADYPGQVLVPIETSRDVYGDGRSRYDTEVERLVGKQGIWFGEIVVRKDYGDDRKALEDPITLLQAADAKKRAVPGPLNIKHLKEVTDSIARVKAGGQTAAALKE